MRFVSWLYRIARLARDVEVVTSGDPSEVSRRLTNKVLGRHLIRRLWIRGGRR